MTYLFIDLWGKFGKKKKLKIQALDRSRHEVRTWADISSQKKGTQLILGLE